MDRRAPAWQTETITSGPRLFTNTGGSHGSFDTRRAEHRPPPGPTPPAPLPPGGGGGGHIILSGVKSPPSGASFWEVPSVTGEAEAVKEVEGVVVFKQLMRGYWESAEVTNTPPTCSSNDGVEPKPGPGRQAAICTACPHSQWGSGKEGRGQACKQRLAVFFLRENEEIPTLLSLPPTAIKPFGAYAGGSGERRG